MQSNGVPEDREAPVERVRIELHPRCLLTPLGARRLYLASGAIILAVSIAAALYGAWPALLFAGIELLVLHWALQLSLRRGRDAEIIEISDREVLIIVQAGSRSTGTSFQRHWARVRLMPAVSPSQPTHLLVECQGRRHELGAFLTDDERAVLAKRLRHLIGRIDESPALPATNVGS